MEYIIWIVTYITQPQQNICTVKTGLLLYIIESLVSIHIQIILGVYILKNSVRPILSITIIFISMIIFILLTTNTILVFMIHSQIKVLYTMQFV